MNNRVILIILDSCGIGAAPDCELFGDHDCNTLGNTAYAVGGLRLPNLQSLGLGNIAPIEGVEPSPAPQASFGKMQERSAGKDTTTGHWEMMGIVLSRPFPTYPQGFPVELIAEFERRIGRKTLGNVVASGTEIIARLGQEHMNTGFPIVYTSADSVFQIAAHEEIIPLADLYQMCKTAREMLTGEHAVGRVIARPFIGNPGHFTRTAHRHDFSLLPPPSLLNLVQAAGQRVVGVGKIYDIFAGSGISETHPVESNRDAIERVLDELANNYSGLVFANLVDFDQSFGHRRDPQGYAAALAEFDQSLPGMLRGLKENDLLIISADHGCDPTVSYSTDHTREFVPLLVYGPHFKPGVDLETRSSFADIGQTIAEYLGVPAKDLAGNSFLPEVEK
ncbi:MAG: phosphopentomutase [Syntrophomonas sp.]